MQGKFPIMQENEFTKQTGISRHCSTIIHCNWALIMINNLSLVQENKKEDFIEKLPFLLAYFI